MRQAGRYLPEYRALREKAGDFLTLCLTPDLATEVTLQPVRRFHMDAAILFADILLVPYALGQNLAYREGEGPILQPIGNRADIENLNGNIRESLDPVFTTVRQVRRALPPDVALIGFAGAPWTVTAYMVQGRGGNGFALARRWAFSDPQGFRQLMERLMESTVEYLTAQIEAGADAVQIFDSWAGLVPGEYFEEWVIQPTKKIVAALRNRYPLIPVIGFPRGSNAKYEDYVAKTGVTAVGIDESADPVDVDKRMLKDAVIQGNMDPQWVVVGGKGMQEAARRIVRAFSSRPHIFNLGHGLVPETPPDHVALLCDTVREVAS